MDIDDQIIELILESKEEYTKQKEFNRILLSRTLIYFRQKKHLKHLIRWEYVPHPLLDQDVITGIVPVERFEIRNKEDIQQTLNVYLLTQTKYNDEYKEYIFPDNPAAYERNNDIFMMIVFDKALFRFLQAHVFKWVDSHPVKIIDGLLRY